MKNKIRMSKIAAFMVLAFTVVTSFMPIRVVEANRINNRGRIYTNYLFDSNVKNTSNSNKCNVNEILSGNNLIKQRNNDKIISRSINLEDEFKLVRIDSKGQKKDSDNDGISDSREIMIGTDPLKKDSNNDRINDVDEIYDTIIRVEDYEKDPNIDVSISCNIKGENVDDIILTNMEGSHNFITKDIPGYIGAPFRVGVYKENFTKNAKITFNVNPKVVNKNKLGLYMYNEDRQGLEEVKDGIIQNNNEFILNTTLTHNYKEYVVLLKDKWDNAWKKEILSPNRNNKEIDVVLAIDSDISANKNKMLKEESEKFINSLQGENKEAIVNFKSKNSIVKGLTKDKNALSSIFNTTYSSEDRELGIANGLKYAIKALVPEVEVTEKSETKESGKHIEENIEKNIREQNQIEDIKEVILPKDKVTQNLESRKNNCTVNKENNEVSIPSNNRVNKINAKNNLDNTKTNEIETSINNIVTEYTNLPPVTDNKERYIVLLSDKSSPIGANDPTIVYAKNNGIKIFTVSLGDHSNEDILKSIAKATGGEYLNDNNSEKTEELLDDLSKKDIDLVTDNDGDGIPNYYEENLRLINGIILKLNPNKADSDGDGISDELELFGKEHDIDVLRNNYNENKKAFNFNSRPDLIDTDFDGINDGQDTEPKKRNVTTTTLLKFSDISYQELKQQYVGNKVKEIKGKLGNSYYNGNISREDIDKWNIIDLDNGYGYMAGFGALAVVDGRNLIVSFPGTGADFGDIVADASIVAGELGNSNYQTTEAREFIRKVLKKLKGKIDNVFVTGHSLGGYLAQYAVFNCVENKLEDKTLTRDIEIKGVTFNSARFSSTKALQDDFTLFLNKNTPSENVFGDKGKYKDIVTNYRIEWDPVSSSINGYFLGKTVELADKIRWDIPGLGAHMLYNFYKHFS